MAALASDIDRRASKRLSQVRHRYSYTGIGPKRKRTVLSSVSPPAGTTLQVERGDVPYLAEDTIELPTEPASAGRARDFVRDRLRRSCHDALEDAALLCVSELVANVSVHTDSPQCLVTVKQAERTVTIEVTDESGELPAMEAPSLGAEHGRGLRIVDAVAGAWGVTRSPDRRKSVWVRLCDSAG